MVGPLHGASFPPSRSSQSKTAWTVALSNSNGITGSLAAILSGNVGRQPSEVGRATGERKSGSKTKARRRGRTDGWRGSLDPGCCKIPSVGHPSLLFDRPSSALSRCDDFWPRAELNHRHKNFQSRSAKSPRKMGTRSHNEINGFECSRCRL